MQSADVEITAPVDKFCCIGVYEYKYRIWSRAFARGCVYKTDCLFICFFFSFLAAGMNSNKGKVFPSGCGPIFPSNGRHAWDFRKIIC